MSHPEEAKSNQEFAFRGGVDRLALMHHSPLVRLKKPALNEEFLPQLTQTRVRFISPIVTICPSRWEEIEGCIVFSLGKNSLPHMPLQTCFVFRPRKIPGSAWAFPHFPGRLFLGLGEPYNLGNESRTFAFRFKGKKARRAADRKER